METEGGPLRSARHWFLGCVLVVIALGGAAWLSLRWMSSVAVPEAETSAEREPQFSDLRSFHYAKSVLWGEVNKGYFNPLVRPRYVSPEDAETFVREDDRVLVVRNGKGPLVFPEFMMSFHHVVNEVIASHPVAITFCQLSGSFAAYLRSFGNRVLTLGVSGLLYGGNSVLYDRETESLWLQLSGESIEGPLAGGRLRTWTSMDVYRWRDLPRTPGTRVLAPLHQNPFYRNFYEGIEEERFGHRVVSSNGGADERLPPYTQGLGVHVRGESRFFPKEILSRRQVLCDEVGGWGLLLLYDGETDGCRMFRRFLDGRRLSFRGDSGELVDIETGSRWNRRGECVGGPLAGHRLAPLTYTQVYWYSWASIYPESTISGVAG